ncbi:MAG: OmpA family protein [Nitrospirales bacterium]
MLERRVEIRWHSFFYWISAIFVAGWLSLTGCSSFHEVTVVGHGAQDPGPPLSAESKVNPDMVVPEPIETPNAALEQSESPLAPKPISAQTATKEVKADILAQSDEETSLPWTLEDVFFEFDQYFLRPDAIRILELNAKVLKGRYPDRELILQGHCDELGTEEYNLILGERRASAVKNFLKDLGVLPANLRVLSLGKMQPFCFSRTIECLRKNRRVHFVFK